ncbi:MAG: hypothetical protein JSS69_14885 [Acidobacteria bacterium]|nr:hypothetical protein [Acidobacteriota bacterium]MBS1867197.1 hypothetical protein [Acidobacteriota bacterium]
MTFAAHLPGYKTYNALRDSAFRLGVYIGLCLFGVFGVWVVVANKFPVFERVAFGRNILAFVAAVLFALIPIARFRKSPGSMLGSGLIAWAVFSFLYRLSCLYFTALPLWHTAWQVFTAGALLYLIAATLAWIVGLVFRVRASHSAARQNHQLT